MSVAEQLQRTPRGRLRYDRHRVCLQSIEDVLNEIQTDMDSMQVKLAGSPGGFSSPPSFGLSDDSDPETPLLPRTARMTWCSAWSPPAYTVTSSPAAAASPTAASPAAAAASPTTTSHAAGTPAGPGPSVASLAAARSPGSQRTPRPGGSGRSGPSETGPVTGTPRAGGSGRSGPSETGPVTGTPRAGGSGRSGPSETGPVTSTPRPGGSGRSGPSETGPVTSTPRPGQPPTPFTPRAYDKLLHDEKQRHLQEAKDQARTRLLAVEATLQQLRQQHEQRRQQLAAAQQRRGQQEREQRSLQRQRSEQQLRQQQESIRQRQQMDAKDLSERVQAAVQQQQADEEEHRQRAARQRALLDRMVAAQKQMHTVVSQVFNSIKSCADRARLQASPAASRVEQLKQLVSRMDRLAAAPPAQLGVPEAETAVTEATQLAELVTATVDEINASVAAAAEAAKEVKPEPAAAAVPVAVPQPAAGAQSTPSAGSSGELPGFVQEENRVWYEELQQKAAQFRAQFADLLTDPAFKKFKFDCQKAVNTPINAISPVSTAHLRDKLDRLRQLLRGRPVVVTGGQVCAAAHPHGVAFCLDLVAKKFVRQGEDVVSSKPEAAFALAAVLLALQLEFPQLAELTLAHCQARCPYLVPLYPPQLDGDSDEQYYRKLGYDYVDGAVEKQDKFLKRMSGVARLYIALLIARPPQSAAAAPAPARSRPLGVPHLWRWLAAVVNLEPRVDITASLLHDVLEVGGATLSALYGAQFLKLVRLICSRYLPRVQQVTPSGCGGPVVRLEQQLQTIISTGRVQPPQGELRLYNW